MTEEELDKEWALLQKHQAERDAKREAKMAALPEEERKRIEEEYSDPSLGRFLDNPLGDDTDNED